MAEPLNLGVGGVYLNALEAAAKERDELRAEVERLRKALFMTAAHSQGGHSESGMVVAKLLGVPFPVRMKALEKKAKAEGYDTHALWPWLYQMRAGRVTGDRGVVVLKDDTLNGGTAND